MSTANGIDPRGPRFGASITSALLIAVLLLALTGGTPGSASDPSFLLLAGLAALFWWGALAGIRRHPWGLLFARLVRPRLAPPAELEDPAAPTFAQGVGAVITSLGLVLHLAGVPGAIAVAAGLTLVAALLNAVVGFCLGCWIHVLLVRAGVLGRRRAAV